MGILVNYLLYSYFYSVKKNKIWKLRQKTEWMATKDSTKETFWNGGRQKRDKFSQNTQQWDTKDSTTDKWLNREQKRLNKGIHKTQERDNFKKWVKKQGRKRRF